MGISFTVFLRPGCVARCGVAAAAALSIALAAQAGDIPGAKDPAFLKRYQGSQIVFSATRSFDDYALVVPDPAHPGNWTSDKREGAVTRLFYRVPAGHTALELLRNYEQASKEAGFAIAYEQMPCKDQQPREPTDRIFNLVQGTGIAANPFVTRTGSYVFAAPLGSFCFFTAKGAAGGQDIGLTVGVVEEKVPSQDDRMLMAQTPLKFAPGEILVMVDVVATKAMENKMVVVKAVDIADALANKGFIDLYGVYFDTDKTAVKPESAATLDEVATLLKIDRSLKLEISGHTDNTGKRDHNLKLSLGRAQAVVQTLVTKYGIDAKRLIAKGYGDSKPVAPNTNADNKAKNRRVELRKI